MREGAIKLVGGWLEGLTVNHKHFFVVVVMGGSLGGMCRRSAYIKLLLQYREILAYS